MDCYLGNINFLTHVYAASIAPLAIIFIVWCTWALKRLWFGARLLSERRARLLSEHLEVSLLISFLVTDVISLNVRAYG